MDEDGIEIDIVGRILSLENPREFERDTGEKGQVFVQQAAWDDLLVSNAAESRRACQKRIA